MDFSNDLLFMAILIGSIFILTGTILLKFPPKEINLLYGYRTKRSMKSKDAWDFAQLFSAKKMIKGGFIFLLIGLISLFLELSQTLNIIIGMGFLLLTCIYLIYSTEKKLKQKFDKNETL